MNVTKFIPNAVTRKVARSILTTKKNSPHIFFAAGLVGTIASTVLASRATLQLGETLDEFKENIEEVKALNNQPQTVGESKYHSQYNRDMAYVYATGTLKLGKLYGPAVVVGGLSIAALTGSHVTLTRRNTALTAAYAGVAKAYEAYRDRVREELGVDRELDIYHSATSERVKNEDGKLEVVKTADPNTWSPYARFFDEASPNWRKNAELNKLFVQCQQQWANQLLQSRGHVFLNEVYDMLGIPRCSAGQVVGWVIGHEGDNFVDFGIFEARNARFVEAWERSILLDFNVDGVIYDKIG